MRRLAAMSLLLLLTAGTGPMMAASTSEKQTEEKAATDEEKAATDKDSVEPSLGLRQVRPAAPSGKSIEKQSTGKASTEQKTAPQPRRAGGSTRVQPCAEAPLPPGTIPFEAGESITFDVDIMGVRAARLTLTVDEQDGGGMSFSAKTRTNAFFANVREVEGRAKSYARDGGLTPARYTEDAVEDGVRKWAEVLFPSGRKEVDVRFGIGERERRVRYPVTATPHDLLSTFYYLRTIDLSVGQEICLDVYGNRRVWRVSGKVAEEEFIRTPAGGFETWRLSGTATRMDLPRVEREVHVWITKDDRRMPVAAMSSIDLGPVRARLSSTDDGRASRRPDYGGGRW